MKVSVVIPSYNEEKYIGKCLESLLRQSYKDLEIIIIDDGSTDRTLEILRDYEKRYGNIRILTQEHKGPGEARNLGARKAKGEILVFVDADMEFDKDYVKVLVEPIIRGETIGTSHRFEYIANLENIWARCWSIKKIEESEKVRYGGIFRAIKKDAFLKVGGFNPKNGFFDDGSVYQKINVKIHKNLRTNAKCYHNNPSSLKEVFNHAKWIGGSFVLKKGAIRKRLKKFRRYILSILALIFIITLFFIYFQFKIEYMLIIPLISIICVVLIFIFKRTIKERFFPYIFALPIFYVVKFSGFFVGSLTQIFYIIMKKIQGQEVMYKY